MWLWNFFFFFCKPKFLRVFGAFCASFTRREWQTDCLEGGFSIRNVFIACAIYHGVYKDICIHTWYIIHVCVCLCRLVCCARYQTCRFAVRTDFANLLISLDSETTQSYRCKYTRPCYWEDKYFDCPTKQRRDMSRNRKNLEQIFADLCVWNRSFASASREILLYKQQRIFT